MLHVDAFIEDLAEADRDRLQDAKQSIQQGRAKIGIVNEIVRNTVDVPGNADRVNKTEGQHSPKWETREKVKHSEEVGAVENSGQYWNGIPSGEEKILESVCTRPITSLFEFMPNRCASSFEEL